MLKSLGLGGDGDEIDAIEAVENAFSIRFDQSDANSWICVGDVFASLIRRLGSEPEQDRNLWRKFVAALGEGADLYPEEISQIDPQTKLLQRPISIGDFLRGA